MNPFEMPFPNPFGKTWLTSSFEAPAQSGYPCLSDRQSGHWQERHLSAGC